MTGLALFLFTTLIDFLLLLLVIRVFSSQWVSEYNQINKAINILKSKPKIKRTMWSRRAQEYDQKINSGKLYDLAEVVRDLNKKTDIIAEQSYSERQLFEKAYDRLLSELEVVIGEKAKIKMDKALNRLENPIPQEIPA